MSAMEWVHNFRVRLTNENCNVLLLVERKRVQPFQDTLPRNEKSNCFSEDVANESQEDDRNRDALWFEHVNGRKNRSEAGKSRSCLT